MRMSWAVGVAIPVVALTLGCPAAPASPPTLTPQEQAFLRELQHDDIPYSDPLMAVQGGSSSGPSAMSATRSTAYPRDSASMTYATIWRRCSSRPVPI